MNYTLRKIHLKDTQADIETDRSTYIGCSDIGTIMGVNPWKSPYTLWAEKTGKKPVEDISDKPAVWWGNAEEDLVAKYFTKVTGHKVRRSNFRYWCEELPFLYGHIDRMLVDKSAGLEIKTTSVNNKTNYEEGDIPDSHYWQIQGYLLVTGMTRWYIATKRDNSVYIGIVERNEEDIAKLVNACQTFWNCVTEGIPPKTDGKESTTETLNQIFTPVESRRCMLSDEADVILSEIVETEAEIKRLQEKAEALKNEIKNEMENCDIAEAEGYVVTWKPYIRQTFDSKKFKEDQPGIYKLYSVGKKTRRFVIKEK